MKDVLEGLKRAKALLEGGWTQFTRARDAENNPVAVGDTRAVKFCMEGACRQAEIDLSTPDDLLAEYVEDALVNRGKNGHVPEWNDQFGRTKEEVLELMEEAIHAVEE